MVRSLILQIVAPMLRGWGMSLRGLRQRRRASRVYREAILLDGGAGQPLREGHRGGPGAGTEGEDLQDLPQGIIHI